MISPARRRRLGRTGAALAVFVAWDAGVVTRLGHLGVTAAVVVGFLLFAVFQAYLLWCLDTLNTEVNVANQERNTAVEERDLAYASRDTVWAEARGLIKTSEEVVEASKEIMRQNDGRRAFLAGDPSIMERLVAEARRQGADIEYVALDDLDGV